jgi:hypothetical protein
MVLAMDRVLFPDGGRLRRPRNEHREAFRNGTQWEPTEDIAHKAGGAVVAEIGPGGGTGLAFEKFGQPGWALP